MSFIGDTVSAVGDAVSSVGSAISSVGGAISGAGGAIAGLFVDINPIQEAAQMIGQQQQAVNGVADMLKGFIPVLGAAWKGDDAEQFPDALSREVLKALSGMDMNLGSFLGQLSSAVDIVNQADNAVNGMVGKLVDVFNEIP